MANEVTPKRIDKAVEDAQFRFWQIICENFPEVKTGDFPWDASHELDEAMISAVCTWLTLNHPDKVLIDYKEMKEDDNGMDE